MTMTGGFSVEFPRVESFEQNLQVSLGKLHQIWLKLKVDDRSFGRWRFVLTFGLQNRKPRQNPTGKAKL